MADPQTIPTRDVLGQLLAEITETDPEMLPPPFPIEKGEKRLGVLTDEYSRRVFSLSSFYRREAKRLEVDLKAVGEEPTKNFNWNQLRQKHEVLQEIFWFLMRHHHDVWGCGVGVRKNWEIVDTDGAEDDGALKVFKKLLES